MSLQTRFHGGNKKNSLKGLCYKAFSATAHLAQKVIVGGSHCYLYGT
jgi:hypothetical protein